MNNPQQQIITNAQNITQLQNDVRNLSQVINRIDAKLNQVKYSKMSEHKSLMD